MRRREFITLLGGTAVWPAAARAQQPAMPVIGFLTSRTPKQAEYLVAAFREGLKNAGYREGLKNAGYVEGQNVAVEYRYADGQYKRLPALAAELVSREVAVVVAGGTSGPAMAATKTIPIVFTTGFDPVSAGLVSNLNRPNGNATGATFYSGALGAKQMELLLELAPKTATFGLLVNPNGTSAAAQVRDTQSAARVLGRELHVMNATSEAEIDGAFVALAELSKPALLIGVDPFFDSRPSRLINLAARYALPTAYYLRDFVQAGGLLSYGASIADAYRQAGLYAGRVLKGERPADLPIQLPTKFELAINLKTAKTLGLSLPLAMQVSADEVIE